MVKVQYVTIPLLVLLAVSMSGAFVFFGGEFTTGGDGIVDCYDNRGQVIVGLDCESHEDLSVYGGMMLLAFFLGSALVGFTGLMWGEEL